MNKIKTAIALSLLALGAAHAQPVFSQGPKFQQTSGEAIYRAICQACHMPDGKGAEGAGRYPALVGNPRLASAEYPLHVVRNGQKGMPGFAGMLDDAQIVAVVDYVQKMGAGPADGDVIRHKIPNSTFPILEAVEVPAALSTVYLSGVVPPQGSGTDTKSQTIGVLQSIEKVLARHNLTMGDVIKMQVFLVADPNKGNKMDFAGFMEGYVQFFGTATQPNLPVRSAFQIAALANPAWFVEIEVVAVRRK